MPDRYTRSNGTHGRDGCLERGDPPPRHARKPAELCLAGDVYALVMGPDDALCTALGDALDARGLITATAFCESVMAALLQERTFQLVVLDCGVGELRAEEVLGRVRQCQPDAGLVVLTASPSYDVALACLRARASDCLTKPVGVADVWQAAARCLHDLGLLRVPSEALHEALGQFIRERRKALRLTLDELGRRAGVSLGYLSQVELGKNAASVEVLHGIASALGMTIADLFQAAQPKP